MKKAIVTGANGFVASYLIQKLLEEKVEVVAVVRNEQSDIKLLDQTNENLTIVFCDLENICKLPEILDEKRIDVFYHLAWDGASGKNRANYELQLNNSKYACDCVTIAKQLECRKFICVGTITEKIAGNVLECNVGSENIIYGIAKHTTHCLLRVLCKKQGIQLVWTRLSNIYGANNRTGNIIGYTLDELNHGRVPTYSKAEQPYDLMYIKDIAKALFLLGEKITTQSCYFIGSGTPRILKKYLLAIKDIYGNGAEIALGERAEDGLKYYQEWFSTTDLVRDTGFEPTYSFEEGIRETIEESKAAFKGRTK